MQQSEDGMTSQVSVQTKQVGQSFVVEALPIFC